MSTLSSETVKPQSGRRQLYTLTSNGFFTPDYVDHDWNLKVRPASNIPLVRWPDGRWCHDANRYMRELFERNLSRRNRGGSLAVKAAYLSHLLRYCWKTSTDPSALSDNQFSQFVGEVLCQTKPEHPEQKARESDTTVAIARTSLDFLDSVARFSGKPGCLGSGINATRKSMEIRVGRTGRTKTVYYWDHPAIPLRGARKKRLPISTGSIEAIRAAIGVITKAPHNRMRRHITLKLLEITGARRGEVAEILVADVVGALRMKDPMLRVPTFKKRKAEERFIPISRHDAEFLGQYVRIHRASVMRRAGVKADHGYLLVNGNTGTPLTPLTITDEIGKLAAAAGIKEATCPHMFRHRYITKMFVALIEHHGIENKDAFRRMMLDSESMKRKVAECTGHSDLASLSRYIDLAFDEVTGFKKTLDIVHAVNAVDSFTGTIEIEIQRLISGESPLLSAERLVSLASALKNDLIACRSVTV